MLIWKVYPLHLCTVSKCIYFKRSSKKKERENITSYRMCLPMQTEYHRQHQHEIHIASFFWKLCSLLVVWLRIYQQRVVRSEQKKKQQSWKKYNLSLMFSGNWCTRNIPNAYHRFDYYVSKVFGWGWFFLSFLLLMPKFVHQKIRTNTATMLYVHRTYNTSTHTHTWFLMMCW